MTSLICWVLLALVNKNDFLMSSYYETKCGLDPFGCQMM